MTATSRSKRPRSRRSCRIQCAVLLLALLGTGCGGSPRVPDVPWPSPQGYERGPYLQAVTDSSAVIRWRRAARGRDPAVRFKIGAGPEATAWRRIRAERDSFGDRTARLTDLPAGTEIVYKVLEGDGALGPYTFRTAPEEGSDSTVRVLAFGDSGWGSTEQVTLAARMMEHSWDLAVHVGDVAYPSGTSGDFTLRHFRVYGRLLTRVPFFPVPGNHDLRTNGGRPYDRAFTWPRNKERRYYSFRWGRILFVGLDTATPAQRDSLERGVGAQYRWLKDRLPGATGDPAPGWTIVYLHNPLYSSAGGLSGHGPSRTLRETLRPLFERRGVDLVLTGHDHHYERTRPLLEGEPVPPGCGPVYFVTGGGGASRYARTVEGGGLTASASRDYHFLALSVGPDTVHGRAVGLGGQTIDEFRIPSYEPEARAARCDA